MPTLRTAERGQQKQCVQNTRWQAGISEEHEESVQNGLQLAAPVKASQLVCAFEAANLIGLYWG